jgi:hypothetical protein
MQVEALYPDLTPVPGLGREDADPLTGDGTAMEHTWGGDGAAIARLEGSRIRFRFHLENADLYSFRSSHGLDRQPSEEGLGNG